MSDIEHKAAQMKLSIIIVTWNSSQIITRCLDLIAASAKPWPYEVLVFDNASADDTCDVVGRHEGVQLIRSEENLGFGRGNNAAAAQALGQYLLFLNPDAYLEYPDTLAALVAALDADDSLAAAGPQLLNTDGTHQVGDGGYAPTIANVAAHQFLVSRLLSGVHGLYINHPALLTRSKVMVDWIAGTCLFIRRADFNDIGGFDPAIFMYGEDVQLGCRLTASGRKLAYLPGIKVAHLQGATQKSGDELYVSTKWIDSLFAVQTATRHPRLARSGLALALMGGFALRWLAYRLKGIALRRPGDIARSDAMALYISHAAQSL